MSNQHLDSQSCEESNSSCVLNTNNLNQFISVLENGITQLIQKHSCFKSDQNNMIMEKLRIFQLLTCPNCDGLLEDPSSMYCGCTFCKNCAQDTLGKDGNAKCPSCSSSQERICWDQKTNNVLKCTYTKWFHTEMDSMRLTLQGDRAYINGEFSSAITNYDEALNLCCYNYLAWLGRSKVLMSLEKHEKALEDIENALLLVADCAEIYLHKSRILVNLNKLSDAIITLLQGLAVKSSNEKNRFQLKKILLELIKLYLRADLEQENCYKNHHQNTLNSNLINVDGKEINDTTGEDYLANKIAFLSQHLIDAFEKQTSQLNSKIVERKSQLNYEEEVFTNEQLEQLSEDLECSLCRRIFFEPTTTTCGHVFCKECIRRWLDHNYRCPICRFSLFHHVNVSKMAVTGVIDLLLKAFYQDEVRQQQQTKEAENATFAAIASDTDDEIPIFVCCFALPSQKLQLQVYEPRYRLMLRKCLESGSRQFGMCVYDKDHGFADYGAMLEINDVFFVPDGRAFIDCTGGRRFKVLSRGVRDGYHTAKVEWLRDETICTERQDEIEELNSQVYSDVKSFLEQFVLDDEAWLVNNFRMPDCNSIQLNTRDGPDWVWWLVNLLLDSTEQKLRFIATTSLEERLILIRGHLEIARLLTS